MWLFLILIKNNLKKTDIYTDNFWRSISDLETFQDIDDKVQVPTYLDFDINVLVSFYCPMERHLVLIFFIKIVLFLSG